MNFLHKNSFELPCLDLLQGSIAFDTKIQFFAFCLFIFFLPLFILFQAELFAVPIWRLCCSKNLSIALVERFPMQKLSFSPPLSLVVSSALAIWGSHRSYSMPSISTNKNFCCLHDKRSGLELQISPQQARCDHKGYLLYYSYTWQMGHLQWIAQW